MKRDRFLTELSRDHHEGLLLAVRLQQGTRALLRLWSHDPLWQAEYVSGFWDNHLQRHFHSEEEHLFPAAASGFDCRRLVDVLLSEHREMARAAERFRKAAAAQKADGLGEALRQFGVLLERHIRCEEREFFPLCEHHLSGEAKERLMAKLGGDHGSAP